MAKVLRAKARIFLLQLLCLLMVLQGEFRFALEELNAARTVKPSERPVEPSEPTFLPELAQSPGPVAISEPLAPEPPAAAEEPADLRNGHLLRRARPPGNPKRPGRQ